MQQLLKNSKFAYIVIIHFIAIFVLFSALDAHAAPGDKYGTDSDAYDSWITDPYDKEIVVESVTPPAEEGGEEEKGWWGQTWEAVTDFFTPDSIEEHLGVLIYRISYRLYSWFTSTDNYANITIDGLILGRLAEGTYSFSVAQFGLEEGNPYGVAGAKVYVILRNSMYAFFLVYACILLLSQSIQNSSKAWLSLKEGIVGIVFAFMLTYIMPQIIEVFLILRNGWMVELSSGLSGAGSQVQTISTFYADNFMEDPANGLVSAVLLFALQFANFFYIGGYIAVAMQCCAMFAIFPVIAILSLKQKKMFTDWCAIFFSNLAIPLIDYLLFLIPTMINDAVGEVNFVTGIITIMIVWQIIPARTALLRLFGNVTGTNAGRGMAGLGAIGMMAMRMMMTKGGGGHGASNGSGGNEGFLESHAKAKAAESDGEMLGNALNSRASEMQDIDSLMSKSGTEHSHASFTSAVDTIEAEGANASGAIGEAGEIDAAEAALEGEVSASGTTSNVSLSDGDSTISSDALNIPEGTMEETMAAEAIDAHSMPVEESHVVPELSGAMNAGSVNDFYDGEAIKAQDVNMTFDDMRLRNLENMENTNSRIQQLETNLPKAQENLNALESAQTYDKKTIDNAAKKIDENNSSIGALSKQNDTIKENMSKMSAPERMQAENQIKENNQKIQQLREENVSHIASQETAKKSLQARTPSLQQAKTSYEQQTSQLASAKAALNKQMALERNFANTREITGGSGKVYENAAQFRDAHMAADMHKKHINHKNFDTAANMRMLSPQEKSDFYRQRAVSQASRKTAGVVGAVGVGAIGAAATVFGGPSAMATAGVIGGFAGGAAGKKVGETVADAGIKAKEVAPSVANVAKNIAASASESDKRMYGMSRKGKGFSDTSNQNTSKQPDKSQNDIFEQHINYAKAGNAELNAKRGNQMKFTPEGNDSLKNNN